MTKYTVLASIAIAITACALLGSPASADDSVAKDVTLEGPVDGGGTISLTLAADLASITRIELTGITPECGLIPGVYHLSPPRELYNGQLEVILLTYIEPPVGAQLGLLGQIESNTGMSGTIAGSAGGPLPFCLGPPHSWEAGPVETPPDPDDGLFVGSVSGGTVSLTTEGETLTSFSLSDVLVADCGPSPLTLRTFFDPPVVGSASLPVWAAGPDFPYQYAPLGDTGLVFTVSADSVDGTLSVCDETLPFSAQRVPDPTATPVPAVPAIATPTASPSPAATVAAAALPAAGSPQSSGGDLPVLAAAFTAIVGGLALAGLAARALRSR
jgi:hypothetical protein